MSRPAHQLNESNIDIGAGQHFKTARTNPGACGVADGGAQDSPGARATAK
jgi:hypothetical protein